MPRFLVARLCRALARPLSPQYSYLKSRCFQDGRRNGPETVRLFLSLFICILVSKYSLIISIFIQCVQICASVRFREISVPFTTESEAQIARNSLSVDPEPKRGGAKKTLTVKGNVLHV